MPTLQSTTQTSPSLEEHLAGHSNAFAVTLHQSRCRFAHEDEGQITFEVTYSGLMESLLEGRASDNQFSITD